MALATELINKQKKLQGERSNWDNHWSEIAPLLLQRQDDFFMQRRTEGERRTRQKFDDTATIALERGAAAIESVLVPRSQKWHSIGLPDDLEDDHEANVWADNLTNFLFRKRYEPQANFASQAHEYILSLLAFGTAVMLVEDNVGKGIRYKTSHLGEHFIMEDASGSVDTNYRLYRMTAKQASERFGDLTPEKVRQCYEKEPHKKMEFLHVVMPDVEGDTEYPFVSYHVSIEDNELISVGGFKTFPYIISRWLKAPNETYGRSPAMNVLAEIKMLNQMRRTDIKARHNAVDPPILAADQHTIRRLSMKAGAINFGTIDMNGRPLVQPYNTGHNINASIDSLEQSRKVINDAFFVTLFQILVDQPQMTATEVLQRAKEKGTLLAPNAGRQMSEWLSKLVEREISIYEDYGIFEDGQFLQVPESLKERGVNFDVKFTNPITTMQRTEEALNTERTVQALLPFAELGVLDRIDFEAYGDIMLEANGAPMKLFKSDEQRQAEAEAAARQQQMQQMLESAPAVAGAVKDLAQAEAAVQ